MQHKAGLILICEDCPCCIARIQQALAWLMTKLISFKHWLLRRPWLLDTRNVHFINRDCIQQVVKQQCQPAACLGGLTGEKGFQSVESAPEYHFIIGLVTDCHDRTVQMHITKGHHYQALAPLHQCVLDALGFENGRGPVFSYEDSDAIMMHSQLAADVIDTLLSLQKAMSSIKLTPW